MGLTPFNGHLQVNTHTPESHVFCSIRQQTHTALQRHNSSIWVTCIIRCPYSPLTEEGTGEQWGDLYLIRGFPVVTNCSCTMRWGILQKSWILTIIEILPPDPHYYEHSWLSVQHGCTRLNSAVELPVKHEVIWAYNDKVNTERGFRDAAFSEGFNPVISNITPCICKGWNNFTPSWMAGYGSSSTKIMGKQWTRFRMGDFITNKQIKYPVLMEHGYYFIFYLLSGSQW